MAKRNPKPNPDSELAASGDFEVNALTIRTVKLESLRDDPNNAREHNPRNIEAIADSLRELGQQKPIVIDADGVIVAGHGTVMAARMLGWDRIAVCVTNLQGAKKAAFALADNRTGELSYFDESKLLAQLEKLNEADLAIGFDPEEIASMQAGAAVALPDASEATERAPSSRIGDKQIIVTATIAVETAELFERALEATGLLNRADALQAVCAGYLERAATIHENP